MNKYTEYLTYIAAGLRQDAADLPRVQRLMDELTWQLRRFRREIPGEEWKKFVAIAREHELRSLVHQDPFTNWSFTRPRGYAGDASLLDFIYGEPESAEEVTSATRLGKSIYARNRNVPSCRAVRFRRSLLSKRLNNFSGRVLSVACGHLRELRNVDMSSDLSLIAFDQDTRSLAEVKRTLPGKNVQTHEGNIRQIIAGKFKEDSFDFIYAAGLYDYLSDSLAQRLTEILFSKLSPKGRLLFANFTHDTEDIGYMEVYKDWWLLFRDEADMLAIASSIPRDQVGDVTLSRDPDRHLVFIDIQRR